MQTAPIPARLQRCACLLGGRSGAEQGLTALSFNMPGNEQLNSLWQHVSATIRHSVSADAWTRWFSGVTLLEATDKAIRLHVPDSMHQLWIEMNYLSVLKAAFGSFTGATPDIKLEVTESPRPAPRQQPLEEAPATGGLWSSSPPLPPAPEEIAAPGIELDPERPAADGLSQKLTFENFVIGRSNEYAHAAAVACAQKPGRAYNPLFLYGGVGIGKTHLMQAIGAAILAKKPTARVIYITSEEFTNQFIHALQTNSIVKFRKRFRNADALLIDDIQFFAGKERSQEEFFHTFNSLVMEGHRQIVLSSDQPASEIRDLEARLVSRFEAGMTAEMAAPDEETRIAILRKKAEFMQVTVPDDIITHLARKITSNVRRLHGALVRVASWISLHGYTSLDGLEPLLRDLFQQEARSGLTIDRIQRRVAESYDIRLADMVSRKRPANIALPRQIAMFLAREMTEASYYEIGEAFGGRDHGTVMHACRAIEKRMKENEQLRHAITALDSAMRRSQ